MAAWLLVFDVVLSTVVTCEVSCVDSNVLVASDSADERVVLEGDDSVVVVEAV